jgi:N-acetylmuramoyl-L-alanine amidase
MDQDELLKEAAYTNRYYASKRWGDASAHPFALQAADDLVEIATGKSDSLDDKPILTPSGDLSTTIAKPEGKVALVVGHNAKAKGAFIGGALREFEYDFNNQVADFLLQKAWSGLDLRRFNRIYAGSYFNEIREVYSRVNSWRPHLIIELHFNAFNGRTGYSFMAHHFASDTGREAALAMNKAFVSATGFESKGARGLRRGDRGYHSMNLGHAPSVLTEPFFGDYPPHQQRVAALGHERFAEIYMDGIRVALPVALA